MYKMALEEDELDALIGLLRSDSTHEGDLYRRALEHFDRLIVGHVMEQSGGNLTKAAERLGLSRVTLRSKLRSMRRAMQDADILPPETQHA